MKRALFIVLLLISISTVWCQNGTPTIPSAQISVPGGDVMDMEVIGSYLYIANDQFLTKYNISSRDVIWSHPFPNFYGNGNGQGMLKTLDNYFVFTYDGIVTKMSAEDDTLWQVTLPGRAAISLDSVRNRIICYSWSGLLTVLNLDNGQILLQKQMPFEGLKATANHNAIAVSENEFITADNTVYGVNWNSATLVSKVAVDDGAAVNIVWQHSMPDLTSGNIKLLDSQCFYLSVKEIDNRHNSIIFFFKDNGSTYTITDSVNSGGDMDTFINNTLPINGNVLTTGLILTGNDQNGEDGHRAVFTVYGSEGETRTSQINPQADFTVYCGISNNNSHIYTILVVQDYYGGPRTFFLTELTGVYNSAVGNDDPDTPAPQLNLICYPTPTRVGNNVNIKFETKMSKDVTTIEVYNIKGQKVRTLVNSSFSAGQHKTVWNGRTDNGTPVSSGMYFFRMKSGNFTATRKIILMK